MAAHVHIVLGQVQRFGTLLGAFLLHQFVRVLGVDLVHVDILRHLLIIVRVRLFLFRFLVHCLEDFLPFLPLDPAYDTQIGQLLLFIRHIKARTVIAKMIVAYPQPTNGRLVTLDRRR
uniref:Putative secreted protein n=1 Tax=Anopheles darlingi TaxID=43151 RepID=A0A2M4D9L3_ANODA